MQRRFFGDSYDIVKHSLIRWLRAFGEWHVHPMFTEKVPREEAAAFSKLLGASLVSPKVLTPETDRLGILRVATSAAIFFLIPIRDYGLNQ